METITIHTTDKDTLTKIKTYLNKLEVSYDIVSSEENQHYNEKFVKMVLDAHLEEGGKDIDPKNIWESIES